MKIVDRLTVEKYGIAVEAAVLSIGKDWLIVISGGTPHIGAISFGNREEEENNALGTHKELAITKKMLQRLIKITPDNLLITSGIHIDNITKEQIQQVMELCDLLTDQIEVVLIRN